MIEASSVKLTDKMILNKIDKEIFHDIGTAEVVSTKDMNKVVNKVREVTGWDRKQCIQKVVEAVTDLTCELGLGRSYIKYYLPKLFRKDTEQVRAQIFKHKSLQSLVATLSQTYFQDESKLNDIITLTVAVQNLTLTHPKSLNWFSTFEVFVKLGVNVLEYRGTDRYLHEVKSLLLQSGRSNADSLILRALIDLNTKSFMGDTKLHMFTIILRLLGEKEYLRITHELSTVWEKSYQQFVSEDYPTLLEFVKNSKESEPAKQHCVHVLNKLKKHSK